jgi:heparanase 1
VSDSFASTFGWVDKLGMSARLGLTRVIRQQLCCGSAYDLLQDRGHLPTPDYWATLLWKRLMGRKVLAVRDGEKAGRTLRAYAHCAVASTVKSNGGGGDDVGSGSVAVALVNLHRVATTVELTFASTSGRGSAPMREVAEEVAAAETTRNEVYLLTTVEGGFTGRRVALNGRELKLVAGKVPPLVPSVVHGGALVIPPLSVAFVVVPAAAAAACSTG